MRINKYIAQNTHLSRRQADEAVKSGRITIGGKTAELGSDISDEDIVTLDGRPIKLENRKPVTLLLNKPAGYVCSRDGQGSPTVYELIPEKYHNLNIAGRLDKDSSGLVVMTTDGNLLNELTHPSKNKEKVYEVEINRELSEPELENLRSGVDIGDDRPSKFKNIEKIGPNKYKIVLEEGRNRQIRRSLETVGKETKSLQRIQHSDYKLEALTPKQYILN